MKELGTGFAVGVVIGVAGFVAVYYASKPAIFATIRSNLVTRVNSTAIPGIGGTVGGISPQLGTLVADAIVDGLKAQLP